MGVATTASSGSSANDSSKSSCNNSRTNNSRSSVSSNSNSHDMFPPRYNARLNVCDDVDECAEGTHQCDPQEEACHNTIGDYICQELPTGVGDGDGEGEMRPASAPGVRTPVVGREGDGRLHPECPAGFRFFLISCIDVDECAEGTDDCDRAEETCVNEEGGFRCRRADAVPGQDSCPVGYAFNREMVSLLHSRVARQQRLLKKTAIHLPLKIAIK